MKVEKLVQKQEDSKEGKVICARCWEEYNTLDELEEHQKECYAEEIEMEEK